MITHHIGRLLLLPILVMLSGSPMLAISRHYVVRLPSLSALAPLVRYVPVSHARYNL